MGAIMYCYYLMVWLITAGSSFPQDGEQFGTIQIMGFIDDELEKRMEQKFAVFRDDINSLESIFDQKLQDHQERVRKLEEEFATVIENLQMKYGETADNTSKLLHKDQCSEGCTWRQACNGCLCINGQSICTKKDCSHDSVASNTTTTTTEVPTTQLYIVSDGIMHPFSGDDFYSAARIGDLAVVTQQLASGMNVHWVNEDQDGQTALHAAAKGNHVDVMEVLLAAGADKNAKTNSGDDSGATPMYIATYYGSSNAVRALISHGADVNILNDIGMSPLHMAAWLNKPDIVQQLLSAGADATKESGLGYTPAEHARYAHHIDLANIINTFAGEPLIVPYSEDFDDY